MLMLKKTKALEENMVSQDSQLLRFSVLTRNLLQLIIKVDEKQIQLFKELFKPFNLKSKTEWVKRQVALKAQEANHPQVEEAEEVAPAKMKLSSLIALILTSWL